MKEITK